MHGVTQGFGAFHDNWMTGDISAFARAEKSMLQQRPAPELSVRIEAEISELLNPVRVQIALALDIDATREASLDGCLYQLRSKERERERQIDLTYRAAFAPCQLLGASD